MKCLEKFYTGYGQYKDYPFDQLQFSLRFELSHFELKDPETGQLTTYRFDYYVTTDNGLSWKDGCDNSPEFDMDFIKTSIETLVENKPYQKDG